MKYLLIIVASILPLNTYGSVSEKELKCLISNIYYEARGEDRIGMLLVGHVTLNRVYHEKWPNTICEVVFQPNQFSWTSKGYGLLNKKHYKEIETIARLLIKRDFDRSKGSLYYINPKKATNTIWTNSLQKTLTHKNHTFFK